MNAKKAPDGHVGSPTTLGDLLYSDPSGAADSEDDWVRLVHSIAAGDQQGLRTLYQRTHRLVFTLAMRISGNRESAEEMLAQRGSQAAAAKETEASAGGSWTDVIFGGTKGPTGRHRQGMGEMIGREMQRSVSRSIVSMIKSIIMKSIRGR